MQTLTIATIETLEDATSALTQAIQNEEETLFSQSDIIAVSCEEKKRKAWGMTEDRILSHFSQATGRRRTTLYNRLLVGRIFPPDRRDPALSWSHHNACAHTWSADNPGAPYEWLLLAGQQGLSVSELKELIGGKPEGVTYLVKGAPCVLTHHTRESLVLYLEANRPDDWPIVGTKVRVTIEIVDPPPSMPADVVQTVGREIVP